MKIFNFFAFVLLATIALCVCSVVTAHTIEHVIVIMLENRAFDQVYGLYNHSGVDGVNLPGNAEGKPPTCNPINYNNPAEGQICASDDAFVVARCDPNHDAWAQDQAVFGIDAFNTRNFTNPTMKGFVDKERRIGHAKEGEYCDVMKVFNRTTLPIHYAFADHGAMFNKFYCAMVGPTWPNRLFTLLGGSFGLTATSVPWYLNQEGRLYPQKSIIDQVLEAGLTANVVVNDTTWETMISSIAHNPEIVKLSSDFMEDAKKGELPNFAWINPRAGIDVNNGHGSQDFHPDHPSFEAEQYIKDLYEAIVASPKINNTLFIITYDENGGFSDHFPITLNVPVPDSIPSWPDKYVEFDRLGIRIPTMLISPWIPKNMVIQDPLPQFRPAENSRFELTSIMGTVRRLLKIPDVNLTARDAFAARFDYLLDILQEPRTDLPKHLPDVYIPAGMETYSRDVEAKLPLNSLQEYHAKVLGHLSGRGFPDHIKTQAEISQWLQDAHEDHKKKTLKWKASKTPELHSQKAHHQTKKKMLEGLKRKNKNVHAHHTTSDQYRLRCQAMIQGDDGIPQRFVTNAFDVLPYGVPSRFRTISANLTDQGAPAKYCFSTTEDQTAGSIVGISQCYPTVGSQNSDENQWFVFANDYSIRPHNAQHLCITSSCYAQNGQTDDFVMPSTPLTLEPCQKLPSQTISYLGNGAGMHQDQQGTLNFGSAIMAVAVCLAGSAQC